MMIDAGERDTRDGRRTNWQIQAIGTIIQWIEKFHQHNVLDCVRNAESATSQQN